MPASLVASLQRCCDALVRHLGVAIAQVFMLDPRDQMLDLRASTGRYAGADAVHPRIPVGKQRVGRIAEEKRPYLTNDLQNDLHFAVKALAVAEGIVAFAGYPLLVGEQLVGVMILFSRQPLPEDMLPALSAIADALAQGIERRRAEEALAARATELARSNAELEQFAYVASHDLQEPLRMVASFTQLLARRYRGRLDAEADEFIGYAVDGVTRMKRLITDLLEYSRVGTRGRPFVPTSCEGVLRRVLGPLQSELAACGGESTFDPLPMVLGDEIQLEQLFQNLLGNALKFRAPGTPPKVHVSAEQRGGEWSFSIRDNGIGIEPQYFDRIFIIFQGSTFFFTCRAPGDAAEPRP